MSRYEGELLLPDGQPIVKPADPHNCFFPTGWNEPYSHAAVATLLLDETGKIAAVVSRHPDEPAEGGKKCLPGGYVELGQTLLEAAETETLQETGHSIVPGTLRSFAILDGPVSLPGRRNEHDLNIVMVFSARAGKKVQEHDDEVTGMSWIDRDAMPPKEHIAFGHYAIMGMWFRHLEQPFENLPIFPSGMPADRLLPAGWLD